MKERKTHYVFLSIGPYGWTLYEKSVKTKHGSSKSRLQGYGDDYINHLAEIQEGSLVLDTRPAKDRPDFVRSALKAPLVDPDLSGEEVDRLNTQGSMFHGSPQFAAMLNIHESQQDKGELGSLDNVSPERYCAWWQERGARVGYVKDGKINWIES